MEPQSKLQVQQTQVTIENRNRKASYTFPPEFDWQIQDFNEQDALKHFSQIADVQINHLSEQKPENHLIIAQSTIKGSGISKAAVFIIRGEGNKYGTIELVRKYNDFFQLRSALVRRWPGCIIPPIPEVGKIGKNQKQIMKNKIEILNNFLKKICMNSILFESQVFQIFIKSSQNQVSKTLQKIKPLQYQQLLQIYTTFWPQYFPQDNQDAQDVQKENEERIRKIEQYFMAVKFDLNQQKDELKRLAQLRSKLDIARYQALYTYLPQYEEIFLQWFSGNQQKALQKIQQEQNEEQEDQQISNVQKIYGSQKYQNVLEAYKDDVFPKEEGTNETWVLYQIFKYEQKQIETLLQTINNYKHLISDKKYYTRNIQNNNQQIEDINNKKVSLKILLLSGSQDDKKTQLANQTAQLQTKLNVIQTLYVGATRLLLDEIQKFYAERSDFYKKNMVKSFKRQALYMAKLFNLYVQTQKI